MMRKIIMVAFVASIALSLGGCSFMKKVGNKIKGGGKAKTEQSHTSEPAAKPAMEEKSAKPAAKTAKKGKGKRIYCSSKKTYKENTPCWHWQKGARIGKPGYGDKKKAEEKK